MKATALLERIRGLLSERHLGEVLRGSVLTFGGKILAVLLGLLFSLMVSRMYGAQSLGLIALVNAFFAIAMIPSLMGTLTSVLRIIPEQIARHSMAEAYLAYRKMKWMVLGLSLLTALIVYLLSAPIDRLFFAGGGDGNIVSLLALFVLVVGLGRFDTNAVRALNRVRAFAFLQFATPLFNIVSLVLLGGMVVGGMVPVYAVLLSATAVFLLSGWLAYHGFPKRERGRAVEGQLNTRMLIMISFPMFLSGMMQTVIAQTDVVMLGIFATVEEVGIYAIAVKLATLSSFILASINAIIATKFSGLHAKGDTDALNALAVKSSKLIFWATLPVSLALLVLGAPLLTLFGETFVSGYVPLLLLLTGQFVNTAAGSVAYFMNMTGGQTAYNYIMLAGALLNIMLNLYLIPLFGMTGAAAASAVSIIFWNAASLAYVYRRDGFYLGYLPVIFRKKREMQ